MRRLILHVLLLGLAASPTSAPAQQRVGRAEQPRRAAERLRAKYLAPDYEGGYREGLELVRRYPADPELRTWLILNQAAYGMTEGASAAADSLEAAYPQSPWSRMAKALVSVQRDKGVNGAPRRSGYTPSAAPQQRDLLWLHALWLVRSNRPAEAVSFADSVMAAGRSSPLLLAVKARALEHQSFGAAGDPVRLDDALAVLAQARRMDPKDVYVLHTSASLLARKRRYSEAYALLERAVQLEPCSAPLHARLWGAIQNLPDRTAEQARQEINLDLEKLLHTCAVYPGNLRVAAQMLGELGESGRRRELEERILRDHPTGPEAEWVLASRYRSLAQAIRKREVPDSVAARTDYLQQLRDFINRPAHIDAGLLAGAYRALFSEIRSDPSVDPDELLRVVEGLVEYDRSTPHVGYADGPIALAERKVHLGEAERIAAAGIRSAKELVARGNYHHDTIAEYARWIDWMQAATRDALGWVYFNEGRFADAEHELRRAAELAPRHIGILYHLGRLAEARGQVELAEETYERGYLPTKPGSDERNESARALERLYRSKHGSLDGFDAYLASVQERGRERRRKSIAAERIPTPEAMSDFTLKQLAGGQLASDSLRGKVVVIKFWGTWCGPCVAELPDVQQFYERYRNDPQVRFLTISNDASSDVVRAFMSARKLDFPVLLDDGYATDAKVSVWPTTWFVDPSGKVAFVHKGPSGDLVEEFGWRVEMLRPARPEPTMPSGSADL